MFSCRNAVLRTPHVLCTLHAYCLQVLNLQISYLKIKNIQCQLDKHISHTNYMSPRHIDELQQRQHVGASKLLICFTELTGWVMLPVLDRKDHINCGYFWDPYQPGESTFVNIMPLPNNGLMVVSVFLLKKTCVHNMLYTTHLHMQYWYLRRSSSVFGCILQQFSLYDATGFKNHICHARPSPKGN